MNYQNFTKGHANDLWRSDRPSLFNTGKKLLERGTEGGKFEAKEGKLEKVNSTRDG